MKFLICFFAWCILLILAWPVAILALMLAPLVWLVLLPIRLVVMCLEATFALVRAILFLPARLLGYRPAR